MSGLDRKGWFSVRSRTTSAIKLAVINGWYLEMVALISSILSLLIL